MPRGQEVGQPVGTLLGLGVGEAALPADHRVARGDLVGDGFPEIGEVVLHGFVTVPAASEPPRVEQ